MKKILLLLSLFFGVILNAQPFKVDFHVNRDGRFIRTDSEQQFYVFNVDSSYTAEKIKVYVPRIYNVYYDSETVGNDIDYLNFNL